MRSHIMKSLKICLVILCLLPVRAVGTPQFSGANFFMKIIIIKSEKFGQKEVLIDDEDFELVSSYKWHLDKHYKRDSDIFYASTIKKRSSLRMHTLIMSPSKGFEVDHKNTNTLDNRRENLRLVTRQQNIWNRSIQRNNKCGFKGVYKDNHCRGFKKYRARITCNGKTKMSSRVMTPQEAALIYNNWATELFGEFAKINLL